MNSCAACAFPALAAGYPAEMQGTDDFPDDVPVADAVEQERAISEPVLDEEAAESSAEWLLEASGPDWQEQTETATSTPRTAPMSDTNGGDVLAPIGGQTLPA